MPTDPRFHVLEAEGIALTLDLRGGMIRSLAVTRDGRRIEPLHAAPWLDEAAVQADETLSPHLRALAGDFFCAPFGLNDVEPAPTHGWTANGVWALAESRALADGTAARFVLDRPVFGARVEKTLVLRHGHPFVYQSHVFLGGHGAITAAHHAMTRMPGGGRLSFSPKRSAATPPAPLEPDPARGRFALRYPAETADLGAFPLNGGGTADLRAFPAAERSEDFVMLVEEPGRRLGWAAALRHASHDLVLSLKDPRVLPLTLLWMSNGGRDYPPWNGRHTAVLGLEEARCYSALGHAASVADNPLRRSGIPTSFDLGGRLEIRAVLGGLPVSPVWREVAAVEPGRDGLRVRDRSGAALTVGYDAGFLGGSGADASGWPASDP